VPTLSISPAANQRRL
jgi:hypothetical protein